MQCFAFLINPPQCSPGPAVLGITVGLMDISFEGSVEIVFVGTSVGETTVVLTETLPDLLDIKNEKKHTNKMVPTIIKYILLEDFETRVILVV